MQQNGLALGAAPEEFKKDKDFIPAAVEEDGRAFEFAAEELKKDQDVLEATMPKRSCSIHHINPIWKI